MWLRALRNVLLLQMQTRMLMVVILDGDFPTHAHVTVYVVPNAEQLHCDGQRCSCICIDCKHAIIPHNSFLLGTMYKVYPKPPLLSCKSEYEG